jgi:AcrR family transcriptional regulator
VSDTRPTRERLLEAAMRLFGERGYKETTVAQIEAAVGLSPGSGSLYKHFSSKEALLAEGVETLLADRAELRKALEPSDAPRRGNIEEVRALLQLVAAAGLRRMERDRYVNRLLFRGLQDFPNLLARYREGEITANHEAVAALLSSLADEQSADRDWPAIAAVLVGATAHYWLLTDLFGAHPSGVAEERYTHATALLASCLLAGPNPPRVTP